MVDKAIALKGNYDLALPDTMSKMANVLKAHVVKQKLYTTIVGKNYAHVEGWQFAGGLMGMYPKVVKVENLSNEKEKKWSAEVEIVRMKDDKVVGRGFAICSNLESKKRTFDEYAVLSMAQTRAIGKAYRNLIGWVMKLAGYEGTPSEEMAKVGETPVEPPVNQTKTEPKSVNQVKECSKCNEIIDDAVYNYSMKMFKKPLCRADQPKKK